MRRVKPPMDLWKAARLCRNAKCKVQNDLREKNINPLAVAKDTIDEERLQNFIFHFLHFALCTLPKPRRFRTSSRDFPAGSPAWHSPLSLAAQLPSASSESRSVSWR